MKRVRHWKHRSPKKTSARERGVFVDKKPSGGLEFGKDGFCILTNDVVCLYPKDPKSVYMDKCFKCPTYERVMQEMEEEDIKMDAEIEEIHRTGVWK